jgi:hypothetical protein
MIWVRAFGRALVATFRDGTGLWWLAPAIPLIAFLPEMVQHLAEIRLGMFGSADAFKTMANDSTRWAFGYAKIAGLFLSIFAAARFWALRGGEGSWWDLRLIAWRPFLVGIGLNVAAAIVLIAIQPVVSPSTYEVLNILVSLATLPIMVLMLGGLLGDRAVTLGRAYRSGWIQGIAMGVLFAAAMVPAQWLHRQDHLAAMGAAPPLVWALMIWDAILVSLMAVWAGTGLAAGYALPAAARGEETLLT